MSKTIEQLLFKELEVSADADVASPVFILGAPRTGSTTIYKAMAIFSNLPFIANITNDHFSEAPIVGMAVQKSMPSEISWTARHGKTKGTFQPSEGSAVLGNWFGGGNPSQLVSATIKTGMQDHFITSMNAIEKLYGAPPVIKNAWNCFRVKYLATALPKARFVWLQRDIVDAACSDLCARQKTKSSPDSWNSATPSNYIELQKRSPDEQVVENQFEFNRAIETGLKEYAAGRWAHLWFEDFLADREGSIGAIAKKLDLPVPAGPSLTSVGSSEPGKLSLEESKVIKDFVRSPENRQRLSNSTYGGANAFGRP